MFSEVEQTLDLRAGTSSSGKPVFEAVLVEACGSDRYRLIRSPGLVLGIAAGDLIELKSGGHFQLISRGRNICIQIFDDGSMDELEEDATAKLAQLGGRLDGRTKNLLVYSVPVESGFEAIEQALGMIRKRFLGSEWYYGNVYDPLDGSTPLNWWL